MPVPRGAEDDAVAKRLCTGLQIRVGRFDSGPRLQYPVGDLCAAVTTQHVASDRARFGGLRLLREAFHSVRTVSNTSGDAARLTAAYECGPARIAHDYDAARCAPGQPRPLH